MERTWIRSKIHLIERKVYEDVEGEAGLGLGVALGGFEKSVRSRGGRKICL